MKYMLVQQVLLESQRRLNLLCFSMSPVFEEACHKVFQTLSTDHEEMALLVAAFKEVKFVCCCFMS